MAECCVALGRLRGPSASHFEPNEQKRLRNQGSANSAGKAEQCSDRAQFPTQGHGEVGGTCAGRGSAGKGGAREQKAGQTRRRLPAIMRCAPRLLKAWVRSARWPWSSACSAVLVPAMLPCGAGRCRAVRGKAEKRLERRLAELTAVLQHKSRPSTMQTGSAKATLLSSC